jgi:glucokinase
MSRNKIAIGMDIGGGHIKCAAVDLGKNEFIDGSVAESAVDNQASADEILGVWSSVIKRSIDSQGMENIDGIGFGMPGPFDYVKGIALFEKVLKYESLYGVNVAEEMRNRLGLTENFPVRFINDATAFALGEDWVGKGAAYTRVVALTLGSGFGSAFIEDGIPVVTGNKVPEIGAVWHLPYKDSIVNDYISTNWFMKEYEKRTGKIQPGVKELADLYDEDPVARDLFSEYGKNLAETIAPWLKSFGAEIVIPGGNISRSFDLYREALVEELGPELADLKIEISELREDGALLGSARLVNDEYYNKVFPTLKYM